MQAINSKELREGNKIIGNDVYQGKIMTFDRFNEDKTVCFFSDGSKWGIGEFLKDCKRITLTEQILLNCDFKKSKFGATPCQFMHPIYKIGFDIVGDCFLASWGNVPINELKYLHQLQNLFYTLIGEEIEFKTNKMKHELVQK